jgi:hypothetical protein
MQQVIKQHIRRCVVQRRIDTVLAFLSLAIVLDLIVSSYSDFSRLLAFFIFAIVVHVVVLLYCRRLWHVRIEEWKSTERWCEAADTADDTVTLLRGLRAFPEGSANRSKESQQLRSISS